jgi:hypothetical protein
MTACRIVLSIALAAAAAGTTATPIYRCGQTYSQAPCPDGRLIDSADPRSAAQRVEAKRMAEREKRLAAQMERDRLAKEAAGRPATAAGFDSRAPSKAASAPAKAAKSKKKPGKGKAASSAHFTAVDPAAKKK